MAIYINRDKLLLSIHKNVADANTIFNERVAHGYYEYCANNDPSRVTDKIGSQKYMSGTYIDNISGAMIAHQGLRFYQTANYHACSIIESLQSVERNSEEYVSIDDVWSRIALLAHSNFESEKYNTASGYHDVLNTIRTLYRDKNYILEIES